MAFKFVPLFALLAIAQAGYIADDPHYAPVTKIFTPSAYAPQVVHKSLAAYATPAVHKAIEYAAAPVQSAYYTKPVYAHEHDHHAQYAYDPHHHLHSHTQAYPIAAAKTIEYAPAHVAHVAKTIEYAPAHVAKTIEYAPAHIAPAHLSYAEPSYGQTHQSVHHGHHGIVSHYGKTVSSPHSHVQKYDTRITNDHHYKVAVPTEHVLHHEPAYHHETAYHHEPTYHHEPAYHHVSAQYPQYAHAAPIVAKAAVAYSPASAVSHTSFQGPNAHYSW